jgi:hypothetical protein
VQADDHGPAGRHEVAEQVPESISPVRLGRKRLSGVAGHGQDGLSLDGPAEGRRVGTQALGTPPRG